MFIRRLLCLATLVPGLAFALAPSSVTLSVDTAPTAYGRAVVITATVSSEATGKVTFYDGPTILGMAAVSGGKASLSTSMLSSGDRVLRAYYGGDQTYAASSSALLRHTVVTGPSLGFHRPVDSSATVHAVSVAMGDFNGDGQSDFVMADGESNVVRIFLGDGAGAFRVGATVVTASMPRFLAVGDFNGDGRADIAVAGQDTSSISFLAGNGDGTFQAAVSCSAGAPPYALAVGDFNGDGKADLAVLSNSGSSVGILLGNGDGSFQPPVTYTVASYPVSLAIADLNHEGRTDLVVAGYDAISILSGRGDGTFAAAVDYPTDSPNNVVAVDDLNSDGQPDIVVAGRSGLSVLLGNRDGTFAAPLRSPASGNFHSLVLADFNGDGRLDAAAFDASDNVVAVLRGNGDGTFQPAMNYSAGPNREMLAVGDFNADGKAGLLIAGDGIRVLAGGAAPELTLAVNHGTGFTQGQMGASYSVIASNLGDLDAPGPVAVSFTFPAGFTPAAISGSGWNCVLRALTCSRADSLPAASSYPAIIATVNLASSFNGSATAYFHLSGAPQTADTVIVRRAAVANLAGPLSGGLVRLSGGVPLQKRASIAPANGLLPFTSYTVGTSPAWVGVGDFNGDGIPDIVTVSGGDITVLPGVGDGTFRAAIHTPSPSSNPNWSAVGDFNHDGKLDLAIADGGSGLIVIFGNGDGTFGAFETWPSSFGCVSVFAADFNGDGMLDLVTISNGAILVFIGSPNGTFSAPQPAATTGFSMVQVGDMNNDGAPDLVGLTNTQTPSITVFLNDGHGSFQPVPAASDGRYPTSLAVGDFNGDGKMDVVLGEGNIAKFLPGRGDGTFGPSVQSNINSVPQFLFAGDFNGDGRLDLAYTQVGSTNGVTLAFGNGDGTFPYTVIYQTDSGARIVAQADFNGDGRPDFAVNCFFGNTVDVFLGAFYPGLGIASVHKDPFTLSQSGVYQITVSNPEFATTSGVVSVTDTLPAGLTATSIAGSGWNCTLATLTCTRSDTLASGNSYPPIAISVSISGSLSPTVLTNQASVNYGGTANLGSDPTTIVLPTTTALTVTPSPANLGQLVTLTATVTAGSTGVVEFSDGVTILGTAAVNSGQARFATSFLPAGSNSLTATYSGDSTHALSVSPVQSELVKAGAALGFNPKTNFSTGINPLALAMGDFNGDGKPDLVTANSTANTVSVLLGNGDGTFARHVEYPAGANPSTIALGDFNNDGKLDIAAGSQSGPYVNILLGNGDGTFQPPLAYNTGTWPNPLAVGDIKGDGKARLITGNASYNPLLMLSLNRDGTFHVENILLNSFGSSVLAVGDFNNDRKPDLAVGPGFDLYVSLGNGDGTFQPSVAPYTKGAYALAVCDLNGDGKSDIVTADTTGVDVLLGNGDGTFQSPLRQPTGSQSPALICADVDGDGHLDVVALNTASSLANVLLGNGDGTLQAPVSYPVGASPRSLAAADFNGDGATDLAVANSQGSSISVLLGAALPVWQIASSHADPFGQGEIGAAYTITVTNAGPGATAGTVTLTDTLPSGVNATAISGTGWTCTLAPLSCTRTDALAAGASYPAVVVALNVSSNAPASVINQCSVSGGSAVAASASDPTTISSGPPVTIQTNPAGLQFSLDGSAPQTAPRTTYLNSGPHTLAVTSPQPGATGTQYVFTGWSDSGAATHTISVGASATTYTADFKTQYLLTTVSNPVPGGAASPASGTYFDAGSDVTLTATATSPYVFTAWSGGVSGAANPTSVIMNAATSVTATFNVPGFTCDITGDNLTNIADIQLIVNEALGVAAPGHDLNRDGVVNVADAQKLIDAVLGLGCIY